MAQPVVVACSTGRSRCRHHSQGLAPSTARMMAPAEDVLCELCGADWADQAAEHSWRGAGLRAFIEWCAARCAADSVLAL